MQVITAFLRHFTWVKFSLAAVFYTFLPFLSAARYLRMKRVIQLAAKLQSTPKRVLGIHASFLFLLFGILWGSAQLYSSRSVVLLEQNSKKDSLFDLLMEMIVCIFFVLGPAVEERWILSLRPSNG
jgi:hypothetical protein